MAKVRQYRENGKRLYKIELIEAEDYRAYILLTVEGDSTLSLEAYRAAGYGTSHISLSHKWDGELRGFKKSQKWFADEVCAQITNASLQIHDAILNQHEPVVMQSEVDQALAAAEAMYNKKYH